MDKKTIIVTAIIFCIVLVLEEIVKHKFEKKKEMKRFPKEAGTLFIEESPIGTNAWFGLTCNLKDISQCDAVSFNVSCRQITQEEHEEKLEKRETFIARPPKNKDI